MQNDIVRRLLPISGIISSLLLVAAIFVGPRVPEIAAGNHAEILATYKDNSTAIIIAGFPLTLLAILFFIPFVTELRATLRSGEAGEGIYSNLITIGGTIVAAAVLGMGLFETAAAQAADAELNPDALLSLAMLAQQGYMPWLVGMAVLLLAAGIGGLRTATLPKPLAWTTVVLGALCVTGLGGIAVYFLGPLWLLATSVVLLRANTKPSAREVPSTVPATS